MSPPLLFDGFTPLRSNVSAHSAGPDASQRSPLLEYRYPFVEYSDLMSDGARRIRKRRGKGPALATLPGPCVLLHEFERVDPATGVVTYHKFACTAGAIYRWNGAAFVADGLPIGVTGTYWYFENFENRCLAVNGANEMIVFDGTAWRKVGIDPPASSLTYILAGGYSVGTVSVANGSPTVHGVIPAIWSNITDPDLFIDIDGVRYQISTVDLNGDGVAQAPILTLDEGYKGSGAAGLSYVIHRGVMSWSNPPKYGAAYFNDVTGHCSDIGPVLLFTEKDQIGVTPSVTLPGSAQNTSAYNAGYHFIKFFRSFKNGNTMVEIDTVVANNAGGAAITLTENATTGSDTALTDFVAPQDMNKPPPVGLGSLASWLGRLFAHRPADSTGTPPDPARVFFSAATGEVSVGVPEECWPRRFERHGVGQPKAVLALSGETVANGIIIVSAAGDWTLEGYDNLTFTPPHRVGTRKSGGFLFGAIDVAGDLVELYRDKRLMHGGEDLGAPIQDKLNAITAQYITGARLHWHAYENDTFLLVSVPKGAAANNDTFAFDYDRGRFCEWKLGFTAMATMHGTAGELELWVGDSAGKIFRLLEPNVFTDDGANYTPFLRTAPIRTEVRQRAARVRIFVGPAGAAAQVWQLTYKVDEDPTGQHVNFAVATTGRESAQGNELVAELVAGDLVGNTHDFTVTFPTTAGDLYIEAMLVELDPEQSPEDRP